ncbi:hypothetical protein Nmel_014389 [Mimus melanotis]
MFSAAGSLTSPTLSVWKIGIRV